MRGTTRCGISIQQSDASTLFKLCGSYSLPQVLAGVYDGCICPAACSSAEVKG